MIREITKNDSQRILEIDTRNATFETNLPTWAEWESKHLRHSRFVYVGNSKILGWIALSPISTRKVYEGIAEVSVYIDTNARGKGIGSKLMERVIDSSEMNGIWTLNSSIFPENIATVKLHEKFGFRVIGTREKIAQLENKWRDTILLERRSKKTGI